MAANGMLHVRMDEDDKNEAAAVLAKMGLSVSGVVRLMMKRIALEKTVPFDLRIPNPETQAAMREADEIVRERNARFAAATELFDGLEKAG